MSTAAATPYIFVLINADFKLLNLTFVPNVEPKIHYYWRRIFSQFFLSAWHFAYGVCVCSPLEYHVIDIYAIATRHSTPFTYSNVYYIYLLLLAHRNSIYQKKKKEKKGILLFISRSIYIFFSGKDIHRQMIGEFSFACLISFIRYLSIE